MARSIKFSEVAHGQKFTSRGYRYQKRADIYNAICLAGGQQVPTHFVPDALVEVDDEPPAPKYKTVKLGSLKKGQACKSVNSDTMYTVQDQLAGVQFELHKDQTVSILRRADDVAIAFGSGVDVLIEDDGTCRFADLKIGERFTEPSNAGKTLRRIRNGGGSLSDMYYLIEEDHQVYSLADAGRIVRRIP